MEYVVYDVYPACHFQFIYLIRAESNTNRKSVILLSKKGHGLRTRHEEFGGPAACETVMSTTLQPDFA